jgi:hypothetical protein
MTPLAVPLYFLDQQNVASACEKQRNPRRALLAGFIDKISENIINYRANLTAGTVVKIPFINEVHDAFYELYESKANDVISIRKGVWELYTSTTLCPYCLIDTIENLDHYFPRSIFPELSISSQNLIPSCGICNSVYKKALWNNSPDRAFIHPYFDQLPNEQFLYCNTSISAHGIFTVSFELRQTAQIQGLTYELLARHFEGLELGNRYMAKATSEEVPKIGRILDAYDNLPEKRKSLESFVTLQVKANVVNTWEHAFYDSIHPQLNTICRP